MMTEIWKMKFWQNMKVIKTGSDEDE